MQELSVLCCYCSLSSNLRCSTCHAPYCSEQCQLNHWYKHIHSCRSPPPLIRASSPPGNRLRRPRLFQLRLPELPPVLYLSSLESPSDLIFLLRPNDEVILLSADSLSSQSPLEEPFPPLFAVFHPEKRSWLRAAQTLSTNDSGLTPVLYVDLGHHGLATEAKAIPPELLSKPIRAISGALYEVKPTGEPEIVLSKMKTALLDSGREFTLNPMGTSREGQIIVQLLDQEGKSLSEELIGSGVASRYPYSKGVDFFESQPTLKSSQVIISKSLLHEAKAIQSKDLGERTRHSSISSQPSTPLANGRGSSSGPTFNGLLKNGISKPVQRPTAEKLMNGGGSQLLQLSKVVPKKKTPPGFSFTDSLKPGKSLEMWASEVDCEEKGSLAVLSGKSDEAMQYVRSTMQRETHEKLESYSKGDEIKVKYSGVYYRGLALEASKNVKDVLNCALIDYGHRISVPSEQIFAPAARDFPALGARLKCIDDESKASLPKGSLSMKVCLVVGGVVLLELGGSGESRGSSFVAIGWPFYDAEATLLLGLTGNETPPRKRSLKNGDEANFLSFGDLSNEAFIRGKKEEDLISIMSTAFYILDLNEFKLKKDEEPIKNKVYACKWSDDEFYYRAEVKAINKKSAKVKVYFIDYGNSAIQELSRLVHLPKIFTSVPPFCTKIKLKGVLAKSDSETLLNKLRLELETLSLTVQFEEENNDEEAPSVTLFSNGNGVNNLIHEVIM